MSIFRFRTFLEIICKLSRWDSITAHHTTAVLCFKNPNVWPPYALYMYCLTPVINDYLLNPYDVHISQKILLSSWQPPSFLFIASGNSLSYTEKYKNTRFNQLRRLFQNLSTIWLIIQYSNSFSIKFKKLTISSECSLNILAWPQLWIFAGLYIFAKRSVK